jgi:hypothetical protein
LVAHIEECRLPVFENRVLRRIFGLRREEVTGGGENYVLRSLMICTPHLILFGDQIKKNEMGCTCSKCGRE